MGVKISEADVQARLAMEGKQDLTGASLLAAKAEVTFALALEQTKDAQGDVARTSDSLANRQRRLAANFEDLSVKLGTLLIPVAQTLVNWLIALTDKFTNLSPFVQKLTVGAVALTTALGLVGGPLLFLIGTIPKLIAVIKGLGAALTFLAANPIGLVISAIAAMVLGIAFLIAHWDTLKANIIFIVDVLVAKVTELKERWAAIFEGIRDVTFAIFNVVANFVNERVEFLKNKLKQVTDFIMRIKDAITNATKVVGDFFTGGDDEEAGGETIAAPAVAGAGLTSNNQAVNITVTGNNIASPEDATNLSNQIKEDFVRELQLQSLGSANA